MPPLGEAGSRLDGSEVFVFLTACIIPISAFAFSIVIPQKLGTRWAHSSWHVIEHSVARETEGHKSGRGPIRAYERGRGRTGALSRDLSSERKEEPAVAAPVCCDV